MLYSSVKTHLFNDHTTTSHTNCSVVSMQLIFIGTHKCKRRGLNSLKPFLTEVSSMTTCQFNNLSSLCTAIFSERRGQLYTCYYLSQLKNTHQPNSHCPKSRYYQSKVFYYFGQDSQIKFKLDQGRGGGYCHIWAIQVCATVKGMVLKLFTLGQGV